MSMFRFLITVGGSWAFLSALALAETPRQKSSPVAQAMEPFVANGTIAGSLIQCPDIGNSDGSALRAAFHKATVETFGK